MTRLQANLPALQGSRTALAPPQEAGTWKTAQPSEEIALRGEWWKVFGDAS